MTDKVLGTKRLEYIDAMRGFTMLLVVYSHISYTGFGIQDFSVVNSFNAFFCQFRMPLFFFVSGFVLYKANQIWDLKNSLVFIAKKFTVQIISPLLFLGLFSYIFNLSFVEALINDSHKQGFWFTLTLFEFFVLYVIFNKIIEWLKSSWIYDVLLLVIGFGLYAAAIEVCNTSSISSNTIVSCLGLIHLRYFIFFVVGVVAKRNWEHLKSLFNNSIFTGINILVFFVLGVVALKKHVFYSVDVVIATTGILTIFALFYKYQDAFTTETKAGRILQYIGKRTLDIYLLHYFFLPRNLGMVGEWFIKNDNPTLEFFASLALATLVIALCLVVSSIIRVSPLLANWLLGVKMTKRQ